MQVAYHGAPENAYAVFVEALRSRLITKNMLIPELEDKNPAGGENRRPFSNYYINQINVGVAR